MSCVGHSTIRQSQTRHAKSWGVFLRQPTLTSQLIFPLLPPRRKSTVHNVVSLNRIPADNAVLRRLSHMSPDAMRYLLALLSFRHLTGKTGIVRMSEVISTQGIAPKSAIINELFEAGVMGQRDDGIVVYHPIIQSMMTPLPASPRHNDSRLNNVTSLPVNNRKAGRTRGAA